MRRHATFVFIVMFVMASAVGCTQGTACDVEHPCEDGWTCIDGQCGMATPLDLCDNGSCTCTCERGSESGVLNSGDCPPLEHFVECRQGYETDEMLCGGGGKPAELDCTTDADCADAVYVDWL
jgi:hypothetical protein